jgi:hypothetical protein
MITIHVASTDIMLSQGMTLFVRVGIGRGRVPFHGPTIRQSIGPRHCNSSYTCNARHIFVSVKYVLVSVKLVCVCVKLLKI